MIQRHKQDKSSIESLYDPELFRQRGHQLVDQLAEYLSRVTSDSSMPVLPWIAPEKQLENWNRRFSENGEFEFSQLIDKILAGSIHIHHPHYVGHQVCPPFPTAALADLTASLLNNSTAIYEMGPLSTILER